MSNRKFLRMIAKLDHKAKLEVIRKATLIILNHPERYSEDQIARAKELLAQAEAKVASYDNPG